MCFWAFLLFLTFFRIPLHSNHYLLSATFSNFKADKNVFLRVFLDIFRYFSHYYWVFYRFFGPIIIVIFIFFPCKTWNCVILTWNCALLSELFFLLCWSIVSVFLILFRKWAKMPKITLIMISSFILIFDFLNWFHLFWTNENQFEKWFHHFVIWFHLFYSF